MYLTVILVCDFDINMISVLSDVMKPLSIIILYKIEKLYWHLKRFFLHFLINPLYIFFNIFLNFEEKSFEDS